MQRVINVAEEAQGYYTQHNSHQVPTFALPMNCWHASIC